MRYLILFVACMTVSGCTFLQDALDNPVDVEAVCGLATAAANVPSCKKACVDAAALVAEVESCKAAVEEE